jgi:phosphoribosylanthranilate isomerase
LRNSPSFQQKGAAALVKSVSIVSLTVLAVITFAESPRRVPSELAGQIEEAVEENVLRTFKVLQEGNQDVPAFERAISKMLVAS